MTTNSRAALRPTSPHDGRLPARRRLPTLAVPIGVILSCAQGEQDGEVSDAQGCRTIVLPEPAEEISTATASSTSSATTTSSSTSTTTTTSSPTTTAMTEDASSSTTGSTTADSTTGGYCGDGVLDEDEECDAGGESPGCDADCTKPKCGDGYLNASVGEVCEVMESTAECQAETCLPPACGDGYLNEPVGEVCDDGNVDELDGCSATCAAERLVFVSSNPLLDGNLGGLSGADSQCQTRADKAGLSGVFMAWLSDVNIGPATRFPSAVETLSGYRLINGELIAGSWEELTSGTLMHTIDLDEIGQSHYSFVWTNTLPDGTPDSYDCDGWTDNTVFKGGMGHSSYSQVSWTDYGTSNCNSTKSLYCVQVQ